MTPAHESSHGDIVSFRINDAFIQEAVESYAKQTEQIGMADKLQIIRLEEDGDTYNVVCMIRKDLLH